MSYLSKFQLTNFIVDITLLVATEFLTRCIFSRSLGRAMDSSTRQINLFAVQGTILVLSDLFLYVFHHTPYFLMFITTFILVRLLVLVFSRLSGDSVCSDNYISQPIRQCNWVAGSNVVQRTSEFNNETSNQYMCRSVPTPVSVDNQTPDLMQHSAVPVSKASLNLKKKKPPLHPGENIQVRCSSPLHRSPLPSLSTTSTSSEDASNSTSSFFRRNFGYFSSLFSNKQPSTIPSGMYNLGNTCFINSILQCLIWTKGFIDSLPYMYTSQVHDDNTRLVRTLDDVVNLCHGFTDYCQPVDVTKLLRSISLVAPHLVSTPGSDAYQSQQDAAEFLLWLLNHLHGILRVQSGGKSGLEVVLSDANISDLKRSKQLCISMLERSKSTDIPSLKEPLMNLSNVDWQLHWQQDSSSLYHLFLGQLIEARECQTCGKMSFSIEYFTMLPLPLPVNIDKHYTLDDCFKLFSRTEDMTHSNMITCSCVSGIEGTLTPGRRLSLLSRPSKRFVIQLTRYSYNSVHSMAVKNTVSVQFPTRLDLFPHTMSSIIGNNNEQMMVYELQGVCVHSGAQSTSYGHYVSYCRVTTERWYYFNDESVSLIDNIEDELTTEFVLQNAYLLFYSLKEC